MNRVTRLAFVLLTVAVLRSVASAQTTRPVPQIQHVILISIDGGRPDLILRGDCPNIRSLMNAGSYTFWARTTAMAITLPSHVSMLTGVIPQRHGIMWNDDIDFPKPMYPKVPTVFEMVHKAGYTTALVSGKSKFRILLKPDTVDWASLTDTQDDLVLTEALRVLREHTPNLLFVHFPSVDVIGHAKGWGTEEQMKQFHIVDEHIGQIIAALDELKLRDQTAILISADHRRHGAHPSARRRAGPSHSLDHRRAGHPRELRSDARG